MKTSVYFLLFLYSVGKHWLDFWLIFKLISVYGANELTGDTGDIVSPLYPSSYIPSIGLYVDSSWTITVDSGFKIRIRQIFRFHEKRKKNQLQNILILISRIFIFFRFSVFEIEVNGFYGEECLSTIVIYDGFDESAEELLRQCGTGTCLKKYNQFLL